MPRYILNERRIEDIERAVSDYIRNRLQIPVEWVEEYNELILSLNNERQV